MTKRQKRFSFAEARTIRGPFVYALSDAAGIFYIGKTIDAERRFYRYPDKTQNLHLKRRLRESGDQVRVEILVHNPPDLMKAEADAITLFSGQLVNILCNPFRAPSHIRIPVIPHQRNDFPPCPSCDEPIDQRCSKYCRKCTGRLVMTKGISKAELRELAKTAVLEKTKAA